MRFMQIQKENSVREPAVIRIVDGVFPRIGEYIGGLDFHSGRVKDVRYIFDQGERSIHIITEDER